MLFDVFVEATRREPISGESIVDFLQTRWYPLRPDLSENDRRRVWEMCAAWSEWLYAKDRLTRAAQPANTSPDTD